MSSDNDSNSSPMSYSDMYNDYAYVIEATGVERNDGGEITAVF